jgi:outer membrane receptor protein involved in Fe transport
VNDDDILFQTTGGAQANVGFFDNVADTRRAGIEASLTQQLARLNWFAQYSFVDATFEDAFIVNSPNHPLTKDDAAGLGNGKFLVARGATIPGIAQHQANLGFDFEFDQRVSLGADLSVRSGVYLRGDEINALARTDTYSIVNLRAEYRLSDAIRVFARVENLFDKEYESFGLLGEPDEVFEDFEDPRFLGAGPPRGMWLGVRVSL